MSNMDGTLTVLDHEPSRCIGAVLWFDDAKGYGFVLYDEVQHFVHYSQIDMPGFKTLGAGAMVSFMRCNGPRGPFCADVRVVS